MLIGYARVSTLDQNLDLQLDALKKAGCEMIFHEKLSGAAKVKPQQDVALSHLRPGDCLVVWKIDRLGRTTTRLVNLVDSFRERGIGFKSLTQPIDTTTEMGWLVFCIFAALAENEAAHIRERTRDGLTAARARGRLGGRRHKLNDQQQKQVVKMMLDPGYTIQQVRDTFPQVSEATLFRIARRARESAVNQIVAATETAKPNVLAELWT
jgi:DNA invertase Pin-like site-specific DNA recombinase